MQEASNNQQQIFSENGPEVLQENNTTVTSDFGNIKLVSEEASLTNKCDETFLKMDYISIIYYNLTKESDDILSFYVQTRISDTFDNL